jgi:hypothetical protein
LLRVASRNMALRTFWSLVLRKGVGLETGEVSSTLLTLSGGPNRPWRCAVLSMCYHILTVVVDLHHRNTKKNRCSSLVWELAKKKNM